MKKIRRENKFKKKNIEQFQLILGGVCFANAGFAINNIIMNVEKLVSNIQSNDEKSVTLYSLLLVSNLINVALSSFVGTYELKSVLNELNSKTEENEQLSMKLRNRYRNY